jgi:hypothetical protein
MKPLLAWPVWWPFRLWCQHPSTVGMIVLEGDRWMEVDVVCLRCRRKLS